MIGSWTNEQRNAIFLTLPWLTHRIPCPPSPIHSGRMVRPICLAVLRLITGSNFRLLGSQICGIVSFIILPTWIAARRHRSASKQTSRSGRFHALRVDHCSRLRRPQEIDQLPRCLGVRGTSHDCSRKDDGVLARDTGQWADDLYAGN